MASALTHQLLALVLCLVVLLAAATSASAAQTCAVTTDPLTTTPPDFTDVNFMRCVSNRCMATIGTSITSATGGYCNGDATAEAAVDCTTLLSAYKTYYNCLFGTTVETSLGDVSLVAELERYELTPGFPLHLTDVPCYACNNFRTTVAPALGAGFTCPWNCEDVEPLGISLVRPTEPGKGYNHVLCGIGCMTCLLMGMAFTLISMFIFFCCGCCWPTPSLRTTVAALAEELEREQHGDKGSDDDDDDDEQAEEEPAKQDRAVQEEQPQTDAAPNEEDDDEL